MAIYRAARPSRDFTILENAVLRDTRLSYRARGILAMILSNTDEWSVTSEELSERGLEGRDAVRTALMELENVGYLRREKRRGSDGRFATQAIVYDTPRAPDRTEQGELFEPPGPGNPAPVDPAPVSQAPIEELTQKTVPTEPPEHRIAVAIYEASDKMVSFIGMKQLAKRAMKGGHTEDAVSAAMLGLWRDGRPISGQTIGQALQKGGTVRPKETNHDHWTAGGGFAPQQEGHAP